MNYGYYYDLNNHTAYKVYPGSVMHNSFEEAVANVFTDAHALLLSKHNDYGPKNIADAPGGALNGLLVRMHDKMARAQHLTYNNATPNHESLEDTFMDLVNYSVIALLVLKDKWPK